MRYRANKNKLFFLILWDTINTEQPVVGVQEGRQFTRILNLICIINLNDLVRNGKEVKQK